MKLLQICNFAPHYRTAIYQMINQTFGADFVTGDKHGNIMPIEYSQLAGHVTIVHNVFFKHGYYQKGVLKFIFKNYDTYLMTGEFRCISTWILLICLRFFPRKRAFIWTHGWLGKENKVKRMVTKIFFSLTDGIFVYNNRSRALMIEGGVPSKKMVTIYNSLDYNTQIAIRKALHTTGIYQEHFKNNHHVIIFLGRLTTVKRLDWLIDALQLLHHRGKCFNLVIVGDGEKRCYIEKRTEEKGLTDSVWFIGACYDERKNAEFLYNADLCVSPGNVGLTAIHAMMYGCPVITNDDFDHQMPEFEAIQKGLTGDFFHDGDVNSLAETISNWFYCSDQQRESIRQACFHEIDSKWTPNNQILALKSLLPNS